MIKKNEHEKEIPKKPIFYYRPKVNIFGICCPNCGELILQYSDNELTSFSDDGLEYDFYNHSVFDVKEVANRKNACGNCGQRIDWSEVE